MVGPNELLYFADLCAGPGGFSEYVLWRKGWQAKGFGFTLRGNSNMSNALVQGVLQPSTSLSKLKWSHLMLSVN